MTEDVKMNEQVFHKAQHMWAMLDNKDRNSIDDALWSALHKAIDEYDICGREIPGYQEMLDQSKERMKRSVKTMTEIIDHYGGFVPPKAIAA